MFLLSTHGVKNTDTVNVIVWDILDLLFSKIYKVSVHSVKYVYKGGNITLGKAKIFWSVFFLNMNNWMLLGGLVKVIPTKLILLSNWFYELKTNSGLILYNSINMLFVSCCKP
jgi:hypothetical protein